MVFFWDAEKLVEIDGGDGCQHCAIFLIVLSQCTECVTQLFTLKWSMSRYMYFTTIIKKIVDIRISNPPVKNMCDC